MNTLTITIGIPAYNEEANIKRLLEALLKQAAGECVLKEIMVISDGSSDATVAEVRSVPDERIHLIAHDDRQGQAARQNEIIERFDSDVLILINGDVLPAEGNYLNKTIRHFYEVDNIGIVATHAVPVKAKNGFEKVINFSVETKTSIAESWNNGENLLTCQGAARAFSRNFAKTLHWPTSISEDTFSYLTCKVRGFRYIYDPDLVVHYRSPDNLKDHIKQSMRFRNAEVTMSNYFDPVIVHAAYKMPFSIVLNKTLVHFTKHPILFLKYMSIRLYMVFQSNNQMYNNDIWQISASSKKLD